MSLNGFDIGKSISCDFGSCPAPAADSEAGKGYAHASVAGAVQYDVSVGPQAVEYGSSSIKYAGLQSTRTYSHISQALYAPKVEPRGKIHNFAEAQAEAQEKLLENRLGYAQQVREQYGKNDYSLTSKKNQIMDNRKKTIATLLQSGWEEKHERAA